MSGWIKLEKDLANDPRVLRMASRLSHADVTLGSRSRLVVVGALVTLWWYADTHIGNDDVLPIGADEVDQLVGLKGFCELMPQDWLEVLDADHVKLVDYLAHNGTSAKRRAMDQKRQERHRSQPISKSRSGHADVTHVTSLDQDLEKTKKKNGNLPAEASPRGPSRKTSGKKPKTALPDGFALDGELRAYAESQMPQVDVAALFESFCGKARAKSWVYADWRQAWQEFCRNCSPNSGHWAAGQYPKQGAGGVRWQ